MGGIESATLMVVILILGSISTVFLVLASSGGILSNESNIWAQAIPSDGRVKSAQKISDFEGNFDGVLDDFDILGWAMEDIPGAKNKITEGEIGENT